MHAGIPLTDTDRAPWLDTLHDILLGWHRNGQSGILTCSALKEAYRARLTDQLPEARFVWLDPPRDVLAGRMAHRPGHFMPPALLDSQLATLEPPTGILLDKVLRLDGSEPIDQAIKSILAFLQSESAPSAIPRLS